MLRLGLDLGTNSIGWVLYRLSDADPPEPEAIVAGGVSIHSDGRNRKGQASNAADRRMKRGPRRNRDRMLRRQRRVAARLRSCGLLPDPDLDRSAWRQLNPLQLRAEALDRPLEPFELGRVLLSFANRRGFKSNRLSDGGEDGKVRSDNAELQRRIEQSGSRTLGEYLWRRHERGDTVRARLGNGLYPTRSMVEFELNQIRQNQAPHHTNLSDDDWNCIVGGLLFQRELRPVKRAKCTFLQGEERILKAAPLFQRFRILSDVNNLRVSPPGEFARGLTDDERELVITKLSRSRERRFDKLVNDASLPGGTRFNLNTTARPSLEGDQTAAVLSRRSHFGPKWFQYSTEEQQVIVARLLEDQDAEAVEEWLRNEYELEETHAEAVSTVRLPSGTAHLSEVAIRRLLPHMEAGMHYHDAVKAAGLGHHSELRGDARYSHLPYYGKVLKRHVVGAKPEASSEAERHGRVSNPTVHIALGQVRRLFNAIVDEYGKPDEVVVELSRDLKQTKAKRKEYEKQQLNNRKRNERLRACALSAGVSNPSNEDMRKLRLWDEQGKPDERICPFTGQSISIQDLLFGETDIEHLLPYSRTLDNSMNNCVISMRSANQEKANRTPHETWGLDRARYERILTRVEKILPDKSWRFEPDAMERFKGNADDDETPRFLDRQLHENSYLSRLTKEYIACAIDDRKVAVTPGRLTAHLRRAWGLDSILSGDGKSSKNRGDHRHHTIDAAVIGMTSSSLLAQFARASGHSGGVKDAIKNTPAPWPTFRRDLERVVSATVVRHRPDHFTVQLKKQQLRQDGHDITSGSLHKDTAYGIVRGPDAKGDMKLVERKSLNDIKPKDLEHVRDHALRSRLCAIWEQTQQLYPDAGETKQLQVLVEEAKNQLDVRRVRLLRTFKESSLAIIRDLSDHNYKAYKTDGNAYMDIWLLPGREIKIKGETVSRFDAHQPHYRSQMESEYPTARKLMRLHRNDMIAHRQGDQRSVFRVLKLSGDKVTLVAHSIAGDKEVTDANSVTKSPRLLVLEGYRKVSVDILGRVKDGGPINIGSHPPARN